MKFSYFLNCLIILTLIFSCNTNDETPTGDVKLFHGGTILPVDEAFSEVEAIAIEGEKIIAVGSLEEVKAAVDGKPEMIDLAGKTLLPGFVDPHAHAITFAIPTFICENIGMTNFRTTEEALEHLKKIAAETEKGEWILANQWDPSVQDGVSELTFKELDAISTDHPIFVLNTSGHLAYVNSKAYEAAGITEDVKNPEGAEYVRDDEGKLNGVMLNNVAFLPVFNANPALAEVSLSNAVIGLLKDFNRYGVTTTSELSLGAVSGSTSEADTLLALSKREDLTARIRAYSFYVLNDKWTEAGTKMNDGNPLTKIVGFKLIADGSNQGFTGLQRESYLGPGQAGNKGLAYMSVEEMYQIAEQRAKEGWQLALHGNGDRGIDNILTVMQQLKDKGIDPAPLRPRIEHCSLLHDEQIDKMKELGVSASFLIGHVYYWGTHMRDIFGEEKVQLYDRCKSVEDKGINYSLQTDFSVTEPDMLKLVDIAVNRNTFKEPDYILAPQERVSVESAIRAVTIDAAWQLMSEEEIGSLEVGKYADLVILEQDPRKVDPNTIEDIAVLETWTNGRKVFEKE